MGFFPLKRSKSSDSRQKPQPAAPEKEEEEDVKEEEEEDGKTNKSKKSSSNSKKKKKKEEEEEAGVSVENDVKGTHDSGSTLGTAETPTTESLSPHSAKKSKKKKSNDEELSKKSKKKKSSKANASDDATTTTASKKKKKKKGEEDGDAKSTKKKKKKKDKKSSSNKDSNNNNMEEEEEEDAEPTEDDDDDDDDDEDEVDDSASEAQLLFGNNSTEGSLPLSPKKEKKAEKRKSSERRRSRSLDPKSRRQRSRSSRRRSSVKTTTEEKKKDGRKGGKRRSSSVGKYASKQKSPNNEEEPSIETTVAALKSAFDNGGNAVAPAPPKTAAAAAKPNETRSNANDPGKLKNAHLSQASGTKEEKIEEANAQKSSKTTPAVTTSSSMLPTPALTGKLPSVTKVAAGIKDRVGRDENSAAKGENYKPVGRSLSADPGKFRNAYLSQVSGGEAKKTTTPAVSSTSSSGKLPMTAAPPLKGKRPSVRKVPSSSKKGNAGSKVRSLSADPGKFRNAYLSQVSGEDKAKEKKTTATSSSSKLPTTTAAPLKGKRPAGMGGKVGAYLRQASGGSDSDDALEAPAVADGKKNPTGGGGSIRNAYLNSVKGPNKPGDRTEVPLKSSERSRERRGRTRKSGIPKRRSSSAGNKVQHNIGLQYLGFGKKSRTSEPVSPSGGLPLVPRPDAFATPSGSYKKTVSVGERSSLSPVRRTMNLTALNLATPVRPSKASAPKPKNLKQLLSQDDDASFADSVVHLLKDKSKKNEAAKLCDRIQKAGGLPKTRRLSMKDNDLIVDMIRSIQNNPDVTAIVVEGDVAFKTVSTTLLFQFVEALAMNLHLKKLTFKGVQLGNDILYALATSLESNLVLEELDLSQNLFTSEGLAEFCQALAISNIACKSLYLQNQTTPISVASEVDVLEAFAENKKLTKVQVDFNSGDGQEKLSKILERNKKNPPKKIDFDKKLIQLLAYEAERAEAIMEQKKAENQPLEVPDDDWEYLYELAVLFDKYKLKEIVESENDDANKKAKPKNADSLSKADKSNFLFGQFKDILDDSIGCFNSDGSFLTPEFISKSLKRTQDTDELIFDFHGQWKLFKRFPVTDPNRELIVTKFVEAIVTHPQMKTFMGINMANTGCGDDFLEKLSERCLADPKLLPNLHMINFETNFINERGCVALSKLISDPKSLRYLQLVRMENQKGLLTSKAEFALCRAMFVNRSVVVVSLRFRGLLERQQIHAYVSRNVDFLRQSRQRHYKKTGTGRKRNEMEVYFDKIAANNKSITELNLTGNRKFLSLSLEERVKAAQAFATNTHVKSINMNGCELGDEFAEAMGKSLASNKTIEKLLLENNSISGNGIRYLFEGVAQNSSLQDFRLHKQSKTIVTADEDALADILDPNQKLTKLGIDFRSQNANVKIDRKLKMNDRLKRSGDSTDDLKFLSF